MRLTTVRAIPLAVALAFAALLVSGTGRFKNAHHGLDYIVGETAWLVFLLAALTAIVLGAVATTRRVRQPG